MSPCRNCEERHSLCHDTCEKYISHRLKEEERKAIIRKAKKELSLIDNYQVNAIERTSGKRYGRI